jgi:hypothetical protein
VWFVSLQDLGGRADGRVKPRNEVIGDIAWDCIVVDEYHFGAWRDSARELYEDTGETKEAKASARELADEGAEGRLGLHAMNYLYLSGTPFRALTNGEFAEEAVFNWTYVDEQAAKAGWDDPDRPNPYRELPGLEVYAYEMGPGPRAFAEKGEHNAFSLTEYFRATRASRDVKAVEPGAFAFEDPTRVSEFLEMIRGKLADQMEAYVVNAWKPPWPYEAAEFKASVRHAVWYMADVAACYAMRDLLAAHPYFRDFEVIVAAGSSAGVGADALPPVEAGIAAANKRGTGSITLSCGKLMTGVTVREWSAILMLRSLQSPESYFQAAFRVQSPWAHRDGEGTLDVLKEKCYVFEFDPNRALLLIVDYATGLGSETGDTPVQTLARLLDFLPIYAFTGGELTELDAETVMEWATASIGAAALARRWNSELLVTVNEDTLGNVLGNPELMATLSELGDFRALATHAEHIVTSSELLRKARRQQGGELDGDQRRLQSEIAKQRMLVKEKLRTFLAKVPVFMYVTDFREEAFTDIVASLDAELFEQVTGLTTEDFALLGRYGLFNLQHMNAAIYQFRAFEQASLTYASEAAEPSDPDDRGPLPR